MQRFAVAQTRRILRLFRQQEFRHLRFHVLNPPAPRAYSADNRSAEITFQNRDIELQPAPVRIVRHIEYKQHRHAEFRKLSRQIKIPLGISGVDDIQDQVNLLRQQFIECDFFFRRGGRQAVNTRQVNDFHFNGTDMAHSGFPLDRNPRIVPDMLVGSGEIIEYCSFPAIRVSSQRHPKFLLHNGSHLSCFIRKN